MLIMSSRMKEEVQVQQQIMWVTGNSLALAVAVAVAMNILLWRVALVLAQDELDPVRNNLSLPQVGLCIVTSLSAVVGAMLKGELRAESSHKDLLLSLHAFINKDFFVSGGEDGSSAQSLLWGLALWLERCCGYTCLKNWCSVPSSMTSQACMIVEANTSKMLFLHKMAVSWFRFNCNHIVQLVVASHPQDCGSCLGIPRTAWPGVRSFLPEPSLADVQIGDQLALLKCPRHGGGSPLSQALMEGSMGYTDHLRLAIMLIEPEAFDKSCLPKAYCSLDAVERNMLTEMARVLVAAEIRGEIGEDAPAGGDMSWSCGRRAVAFVAELSLALILCWAAQMPPVSASLVGRRLVRSHATGAWGNSSLVIAAGNQAQVCIASQDLSFFDISTTLTKSYTLIAALETLLVPTAIIAEYVCWTLVLTGVLPSVFGATPKGSGHLAKACSASLVLSLCFLLCISKNCPRFFPSRIELGQALAILFLYILSQVATWCIYVFARAQLRVALLGVCAAGFGEFMWLAAMWAGAHHPSLADRVTWSRTAAHVAPYLTDAGASLMLYF